MMRQDLTGNSEMSGDIGRRGKESEVLGGREEASERSADLMARGD